MEQSTLSEQAPIIQRMDCSSLFSISITIIPQMALLSPVSQSVNINGTFVALHQYRRNRWLFRCPFGRAILNQSQHLLRLIDANGVICEWRRQSFTVNIDEMARSSTILHHRSQGRHLHLRMRFAIVPDDDEQQSGWCCDELSFGRVFFCFIQTGEICGCGFRLDKSRSLWVSAINQSIQIQWIRRARSLYGIWKPKILQEIFKIRPFFVRGNCPVRSPTEKCSACGAEIERSWDLRIHVGSWFSNDAWQNTIQ